MKRFIFWIAVLASGLVFAQAVLAKPPGGGGGYKSFPNYWISVGPDPDLVPGPHLYAPPCLGYNPDPVFWVYFPHTGCADLTTSDGVILNDHVQLRVYRVENGDIVSVQVRGSDSAGRLHMSDEIAIVPQVPNLTGDFTLHVDVDDVSIYGCTGNSKSKSFSCTEPAGTISLGDFNYVCIEDCGQP